jgi:hypothetical protein
MLFFVACSPTFLAKIAPKIKPNPQLKKATNNVVNVTIAAAFAVLLQWIVILLMILLMGFDRAKL